MNWKRTLEEKLKPYLLEAAKSCVFSKIENNPKMLDHFKKLAEDSYEVSQLEVQQDKIRIIFEYKQSPKQLTFNVIIEGPEINRFCKTTYNLQDLVKLTEKGISHFQRGKKEESLDNLGKICLAVEEIIVFCSSEPKKEHFYYYALKVVDFDDAGNKFKRKILLKEGMIRPLTANEKKMVKMKQLFVVSE